MLCELLYDCSIILGQCGVLGISSDGLCQLFTAVIFHRLCAQGLGEAWHEEMGKRAERKQDIHDLFPASLLGLFICCYRCEWDPSWRNRDREVTFEFQWRLVKVHQSPAPTHPRSRVSLSQWKLLAPEWEAGSSSEKKKKYSLLPWSCHYWKLASV